MSWWSWRLGEKYMAVYCYWTYLIFSEIKRLYFKRKKKKKCTRLSMIKKELWVVWYMDVDGCEAWNYYSHLLPWEKTAGEWNSHIKKGIARGITKKWKWDLIKSDQKSNLSQNFFGYMSQQVLCIVSRFEMDFLLPQVKILSLTFNLLWSQFCFYIALNMSSAKSSKTSSVLGRLGGSVG